MANISTPDNINNPACLNGMLFSNQAILHGKIVIANNDNPKLQVRWSIISPVYQDDAGNAVTSSNNTANGGFYRFGFIDEASKINLNAVMKKDPTGKTLYNMLMLLPNQTMTDEIAASICIWLGGTDMTTLQNGAKDDYYTSLNPPYQGKYGRST
jgi:hypothetical protein